MDENSAFWVIGIIIGLVLTLWIMYAIIRSATDTKKQLWNQKAQINLLIKIAEKLGVGPSEMDIIKKENNN